MKAHLKAAWVAAMRARTDTPARGRLRRGDCFSWEGLLCHVIDPTRWEGDKYHFPRGSILGIYLDLETPTDVGLPYNIEREGIVHNDADCWSWPRLADWTEAVVPVTP